MCASAAASRLTAIGAAWLQTWRRQFLRLRKFPYGDRASLEADPGWFGDTPSLWRRDVTCRLKFVSLFKEQRQSSASMHVLGYELHECNTPTSQEAASARLDEVFCRRQDGRDAILRHIDQHRLRQGQGCR
jgi:hypothetical protein